LKALSADEKLERDEQWMRRAFERARDAEALGEVPVGCVLVDSSNTLIAEGHNLRETSHDPTSHAEMIALRHAALQGQTPRLTDLTAYVTLEPCSMCAGALVLARVARVVYACDDAKAGAVHSMFQIGQTPALNHQFALTRGLMANEGAEMLQAFFKRLRARNSE
jgi:tRNA(adenine34) deaminase